MMRLRQSVAINALWIPLTFQDTALMAIAVPAALLVLAPHEYRTALAFLASVSALAAMFVPPLAGALSDRARRNGRGRREYILAGIALDVISLATLPFLHTLWAFDAAFVIAVAGENVAIAAYQAAIPELVPRGLWGAAAGMRGAATLVGTVIGLGTAGAFAPRPVFFITAALLATGAASLVWLREGDSTEPERAGIRSWHDFGVVFVARSLIFFGLTLLMTFVLYFFRDILRYDNPNAGTAFVGLCSLAGAIGSSIWFGMLSDNVSRKTIAALCGVPMTVAAIGFALLPDVRWMLPFAIVFGVGLGGVMSTGWALAMDSVPQLRDVARDLGIWGIATALPNVVAPAVGGWILNLYGGSKFGYQVLFGLAGASFALGSLAVLRVGVQARPSLAFRLAAVLFNLPYLRMAYRIRGWGRLPRKRGATLVIANHQHDLESDALVAQMTAESSRHAMIYAASSRRMYEPGFFAVRLPWLRPLMRRVNAGPLFFALGLMPLENELSSRFVASLAWAIQRRHGVLPLDAIMRDEIARQFPAGTRTCDLWSAANFDLGRMPMKIAHLREPYRSEILAETRAAIDQDMAALEGLVRGGATFFLTPEGRYTTTGELSPLRGAWRRLSPLADVYLAGVSYDVFRGKRLSMLYRLVRLQDRERVVEELLCARPVTVSQLLAEWFVVGPELFAGVDAVRAVEHRLATLPPELFVDPELLHDPRGVTLEALDTMKRLGLLTLIDGGLMRLAEVRTHYSFPHVDDIVAFQARFFAQTIGAVAEASLRRGVGRGDRHVGLRG